MSKRTGDQLSAEFKVEAPPRALKISKPAPRHLRAIRAGGAKAGQRALIEPTTKAVTNRVQPITKLSAAPSAELATAPAEVDLDSRARTNLANERTFLAWLRTGLTCIALGIAAAHLLDATTAFGEVARASVAGSLVVTGVVTALLGRSRYQTARRQLEQGQHRPSGQAMDVASLLAVAIGVLALTLVVATAIVR